MNWLTDFVRPKIRALVEQKEVPDNLWIKCNSCGTMLFQRDLEANLHVCNQCGNHMAIPVAERLDALFDSKKYDKLAVPSIVADPLKFKDKKRYTDRLKEYRAKTDADDAIVVARGKIGSIESVVAAFNFKFMGGSMGMAVGEGLLTAAKEAVKKKAPLIVIPASGGARMQEGILSLMQMPRSVVAAEMVKEAGLPFIVILTNPTTGGVSASFAMLGDIHIAEPGATIGFAGKRVIQETIKEELPDDFQTAEYLQEHGMVDLVVSRLDMKEELSKILDLICNKKKAA